MLALTAKATPTTLDPWGTVANLGSEILEGDCAASGLMVQGAPTDAVSCGWFRCTKGRFRMVYPFTEHAIVTEGRVTLTDESTGQSRSFGPGEGWFIEKGATILWQIETASFTKNYFAVA